METVGGECGAHQCEAGVPKYGPELSNALNDGFQIESFDLSIFNRTFSASMRTPHPFIADYSLGRFMVKLIKSWVDL